MTVLEEYKPPLSARTYMRLFWTTLIGGMLASGVVLAFSKGHHHTAAPAPPPPILLDSHAACFKNEPDRWWVTWSAHGTPENSSGVVTYANSSAAETHEWSGWSRSWQASGWYSRDERTVKMTVQVTVNDTLILRSNEAIARFPDACS